MEARTPARRSAGRNSRGKESPRAGASALAFTKTSRRRKIGAKVGGVPQALRGRPRFSIGRFKNLGWNRCCGCADAVLGDLTSPSFLTMSFDLTGKIALVTGGARDIGGAISLELARNGADVVVNYNASE